MINDANMWARLCLCLYDSQSGCESGYLCLYGSNAFRGQRQKQPGDRAQCHRFHPQGRDMEQKVEKSGSENVSLLSAVDAKDAHCLN